VPRTAVGRDCRSWAEWDPEELGWPALVSKLVLPAVRPACQDPVLGLCGSTFAAVLRDESSCCLGSVRLVPAPTTCRSPWCSACVARLGRQSWIALEGGRTSLRSVCLGLDLQQVVLSKQETGCGDVLRGRRFGKALWLLHQDPSLLLRCNRTSAAAVCLSTRYNPESIASSGPSATGLSSAVPGAARGGAERQSWHAASPGCCGLQTASTFVSANRRS